MRNVSAFAISALLISNVSAHSATCKVNYFNFVFGSDTSTDSWVKSGTICQSHFRVGGGGITSLTVAKQAQHGVVGTSGGYYWAYKSNPGYVGQDGYTIQVTGESMGRGVSRGTTAITVNVNVVP